MVVFILPETPGISDEDHIVLTDTMIITSRDEVTLVNKKAFIEFHGRSAHIT